MLVTSARTYAAFELVHKDGLKRHLHLLIRRKRGQLCDAYTLNHIAEQRLSM